MSEDSIRGLDPERRPYAAFALKNPLIADGVDLAGYVALSSLTSSIPDRFGERYLDLSRGFGELISGLPEEGLALEDADIVDHSEFGSIASARFMILKQEVDDSRLRDVVGYNSSVEDLFIALAKHSIVRDLSLDQQREYLQKELERGLVGFGDSLVGLDAENLAKVVARGLKFKEREDLKRRTARSFGFQGPRSGAERAAFLEERAGLDFGGYDWNSYESKRPARFTTGIHSVNVLLGKEEFVKKLKIELDRRFCDSD